MSLKTYLRSNFTPLYMGLGRIMQTWQLYRHPVTAMNGIPSSYKKVDSSRPSSSCKRVIAMFDNPVFNHGLADKLRGCLTTYVFSKENNLDFRIHWTYPFILENFLLPAQHDWRISPSEIQKTFPHSTPVGFPLINIHFRQQITERILQNTVKNAPTPDVHIYTNTGYHEWSYPQAFKELFTPAPKLAEALKPHEKALGKKYISVSFRFVDLLGDFQDEIALPKLSDEKKDAIIEQCFNALCELIDTTSEKAEKVLVCSDSATFLKRASSHPKVYIAPGDIRHARNSTDDDPALLKTFVDFFLITQAKEAHLIMAPLMYKSGFAMTASRIAGIPYIEHYI